MKGSLAALIGDNDLQRRIVEFLLAEVGAPPSKRIAEAVGETDMHKLRLALSDLSQKRIVWRSKRGLYRMTGRG